MKAAHLDDEINPFDSAFFTLQIRQLDADRLAWPKGHKFVRGTTLGRTNLNTVPMGAPIAPAGSRQTVLAAIRKRLVHPSAPSQRKGRISRLVALVFLFLLPPPNRARPTSLHIPFRTAQSMILVDGKVNGNPATLLLDTGANRTIISGKAYGNVQFRLQQLRHNSHGAGVSGGSIPQHADLVLGEHAWVAQRVSVMDLDELNEMLKLHFDGLLGQDILRQFRSVRIDYHAHVIELEE
jgi:gag-polyprotein putative aspartyl protease